MAYGFLGFGKSRDRFMRESVEAGYMGGRIQFRSVLAYNSSRALDGTMVVDRF